MSVHWMKIRRVLLLAIEGLYVCSLHLCTNNNTDVSLIALRSPTVDVGCGLHSLQQTKNANNMSEVKISLMMIH